MVAPLVMGLIQAGLGILGNAVATQGKDFIEEKFGIDITKLLGTEEGRVKLAQIESDNEEQLRQYAIRMRELELEEGKMAFSDVDSARQMQVAALQQSDTFSKRFLYAYSTIWSIVCAAYIGFITFGSIPEANVRFADTILGFVLGTVIATMFNFFYGSSKGSQTKDTAILDILKGMKNG
jgi:hypothetical protein